MSSQIYSRYIPLPKNKLPPSSDPVVTESLPTATAQFPPTPPATRHDASSTYARYIPPKTTGGISMLADPALSRQTSVTSPKRKRENLDVENDESKSARKPKKPKGESGIAPLPASIEEIHKQSKAVSSEVKEKNDPSSISTTSTSSSIKHGASDTKEKSGESTQPEDLLNLKNRRPKRKKDGPVIEQSIQDTDHSNDEDVKHKKLMSKREKSLRKAEKLSQNAVPGLDEEEGALIALDHSPEIHDLVPLPQPEPVPELENLSLSDSLPQWLASPIHVSPTATAPFEELGVSDNVAKVLHQHGFPQAFAIQTAVLPLLLPGSAQEPGDVLVSATTGSGKTLSYIIPMVEDICQNRGIGIQGLIIIPTRELVAQVKKVCETCTSAYSKYEDTNGRLNVGTIVGNETMKAEQAALIDEDWVYDPEKYQRQVDDTNRTWMTGDSEFLTQDEDSTDLPGHVLVPVTKVEILVCTPGRLVEHLKSTRGFSLEHLRWLVVDEADKLLDQSFQQWLAIVMGQIQRKPQGRRQRPQRVRKIILSATMTRDVGQLNQLKLFRPRLVVLDNSIGQESEESKTLVIPSLLRESAIKIDDEAIKPLYLIELLQRERILLNIQSRELSSDSESLSDTDDDDSGVSSSDEANHPPTKTSAAKDFSHGALIFTKSNESALRLSRLIALLAPEATAIIGTLTSTTPRQSRQRTIASFESCKLSILVASDLVSRGLDLPNLAHVINYDIPSSLTSYVHRIGRTARAGKEGKAWTLFSPTEGGWFWNKIARSVEVHRAPGSKVERLNIKAETLEDRREQYESALEVLSKEASSKRLSLRNIPQSV